MDIDRYFAEFLGCAHKAGVDFGRTATLGRLNLFIDIRSLEHGVPASTAATSAIDDVRDDAHGERRLYRGIPQGQIGAQGNHFHRRLGLRKGAVHRPRHERCRSARG